MFITKQRISKERRLKRKRKSNVNKVTTLFVTKINGQSSYETKFNVQSVTATVFLQNEQIYAFFPHSKQEQSIVFFFQNVANFAYIYFSNFASFS